MRKWLVGVWLVQLLLGCGERQSVEGTTVDAPAVGTAINDVIQQPTAQGKPAYDGEYRILAWEDLELPGQGMADILKKYQSQIEAIPENDPREDALLEQMQAEMNAAPTNPALDGKLVKIPGFVSPLEVDDSKGTVKEFLLVPYFGACIHVPPPPLNQTLLVKPQPDKSIGMEQIYSPVWVYGTLQAQQVKTDLAEAGYQIVGARVEMYRVEDAPSGQP